MATENLLSPALTNRDASTINNLILTKGAVREAIGYVTTTSSVTAGSTYRLAEVPSSARLSDVKISCAAMGGVSAADFGFYRNTKDGGAVVDADFVAASQSLASALTDSDISTQTSFTIPKRNQPLWQALGFGSDPNTTFDFVATTTATITTGGFLSATAIYVDNSN